MTTENEDLGHDQVVIEISETDDDHLHEQQQNEQDDRLESENEHEDPVMKHAEVITSSYVGFFKYCFDYYVLVGFRHH